MRHSRGGSLRQPVGQALAYRGGARDRRSVGAGGYDHRRRGERHWVGIHHCQDRLRSRGGVSDPSPSRRHHRRRLDLRMRAGGHCSRRAGAAQGGGASPVPRYDVQALRPRHPSGAFGRRPRRRAGISPKGASRALLRHSVLPGGNAPLEGQKPVPRGRERRSGHPGSRALLPAPGGG